MFTTENNLLVMCPYQIAATERILSRIEISHNYKQTGTIQAGGYIWHTTGSGKTLTSFKTAQLATALPFIEKVLFVVDRKDLDYQTMREYERFEKDSANSNSSTRVLQRQLEDSSSRIIITTIQKLDRFVQTNPRHPVYRRHVVIIFDECHRSQFADMHAAIVRSFRNYHLFGFTGTPIFAVNATAGRSLRRTTKQVFGDCLHTYTIVNAINDGNVLPFRVEYNRTMAVREDMRDQQVEAIDTERALNDVRRISGVVKYILERFDQKTKRHASYSLRGKTKYGFNSILATASIPMAIRYYNELKRQLEESGGDLRIAMIYSYSPNEAEADDDGLLPDETFDPNLLDITSRDHLKIAIADYNSQFRTNFDTSGERIQNYYKDLAMRMKSGEVDLLVVVDMFLTGFDAKILNTLWVDKNLRMHGLIQAFSRTNRILNSVKTFGNIVCFRDLQKETEQPLSIFGNEENSGIVLLKDYDSYYRGYDENGRHYHGYVEVVEELLRDFPLGERITGEARKRRFVSLFGLLLRLRNILTAFDEFEEDRILDERQLQDYQSIYLDIRDEMRPQEGAEREPINEDLEFEIELVRQIEVNIDYIQMLVEQYRQTNCEDKTIVATIRRAVESSPQLRSKRQLIEDFIESIDGSTEVDEAWRSYIHKRKDDELDQIIREENLREESTRRFVDGAFRDGVQKTTGTDIDRIMPPMSRFGGDRRSERKATIIERLLLFFERFFGLV